MLTTPDLLQSLRGKLIVSCQASPGGPLDNLDTLRRMAAAVLLGGAGGLRAEGAERVSAFRSLTSLPIIGLVKTLDRNGEVYITPKFSMAASVSEAGADIIAVDCTRRRFTEAEPPPELIRKVHSDLRRIVCADIATLEDAERAQEAGADLVATTLCGYTQDTAGIRTVSWKLVEDLAACMRVPVIVEGHIDSPEGVREALRLGAHAVVVGSAITRPQTITARFVAATQR